MPYPYWTEYVENSIVRRWEKCCSLREDIVPLARAYYRYAETGKSATECLERIVGAICECNAVDIDPNNLNWNDLINQVVQEDCV